MSDKLRDQINELIRDEIQLKVNIRKSEVDKLIKEYKKIKKKERSNLNKIKSLGLVDKNGNPL